VDRLGIASMIDEEWGMTPARDQQIGGLLMWVPMCLVYMSAIFWQLARWYSAPAEPRLTTT
jgi:cytochrome c oxidase assembly factor CtaG